jgi:nicotinamidase-related amidase
MTEPTKDDEQLAELVASVLGVRPERVNEVLQRTLSPEERRAYATTQETIAAVGLAQPIMPAPPGLKERILATVAARRRPKKSALVVVDMVKDHLGEGSALEVPRARLVVPALKQRLERARAERMPVVYVVDQHEEDDSDMDFLDGWGAHNIIRDGDPANEVWPDIAPQSGDQVVTKPTYSAFTQSNLEQVLDELGVDSIVLTGCLTEIGLMATAKDAMERGYAVEVPPDSQAGASAATEQATLAALQLMVPYGPARKQRLERLATRTA